MREFIYGTITPFFYEYLTPIYYIFYIVDTILYESVYFYYAFLWHFRLSMVHINLESTISLENASAMFLLLIFLFIFVLYNLLYSEVTNNILRVLFLLEILILLSSFLFLIVGMHYGDLYGQIVVLFLLTIAAVEAAVGLALIYSYYRLWRTIKLSKISKIKG